MGAVCQEHPPIIQDLKVTIHDSSLVFPSQETERKSMFLSNIDQVLNFNVQTVHFFSGHPDFPPEIVVEKLKTGLCKVLVAYDYLAGRLKLNSEMGRLEIDCNVRGAGFVVASSEYCLNEIGDLVYPNPGFQQLTIQTLDNLPPDDQPLCIIQVTTFKCGGFTMGLSTNHVTFDGNSFNTFLQNLASQVSDKPLAVIPCNDRRLLAARSPPRVTFPHPELVKLQIPTSQEGDQSTPPVFDCAQEDLDFKIFHLTPENVYSLKEMAKNDTNDDWKNIKITSFNVVTAHIWRCKALSNDTETDIGTDNKLSTVLYAVDIRSRLRPPLPASYTGNAVLTAYATAPRKVLEEGPFPRLVKMVSEGAARMTDEYARSAIDWGEVYKGFPRGEFLVSSWWRLGFAEVEYPWGRPQYSCPVVYHRKDIILFFPDIDTDNNNGVNVLVALPSKELDKFQILFHKFLP